MDDSLGNLLFTKAVNAENAKRAQEMLADALSCLMESLESRGFSREESLTLCQTWMATFLARTSS